MDKSEAKAHLLAVVDVIEKMWPGMTAAAHDPRMSASCFHRYSASDAPIRRVLYIEADLRTEHYKVIAGAWNVKDQTSAGETDLTDLSARDAAVKILREAALNTVEDLRIIMRAHGYHVCGAEGQSFAASDGMSGIVITVSATTFMDARRATLAKT